VLIASTQRRGSSEPEWTTKADADIETNRIAIWADRDRRIRDSEGAYGWNGARGPASTVSAISAVSLSDFVDGGWITHESQPVDVPPTLRRAGWAGTALVTLLAVASTLLSWDTGAIIPELRSSMSPPSPYSVSRPTRADSHMRTTGPCTPLPQVS